MSVGRATYDVVMFISPLFGQTVISPVDFSSKKFFLLHLVLL